MSLKILLTDSSSSLGQALAHELEREPFNLLTPSDAALDWADAGAVNAYLLHQKPDAIINCRGWVAASQRQDFQALLATVNSLATAESASAIPQLHFSSYKVFGGDNKGTHSEKDDVSPVSEAGEVFIQLEQQLIAALTRPVILRLSWLVGAYGENLLTQLVDDFLNGESVNVNRRLRGAPTMLADAARVAVAVVKQIGCGADNWGVMHYCSGDACTQEEFAEQVLQVLMQQQLLTAEPSLMVIESDPIDEPLSAILGCRRLRDYFGVQARSWRPSLLPLVKQAVHNRSALNASEPRL
jgi:dTDP-4-dehydrorhamnose reductase